MFPEFLLIVKLFPKEKTVCSFLLKIEFGVLLVTVANLFFSKLNPDLFKNVEYDTKCR
jgi:hypothetical protein